MMKWIAQPPLTTSGMTSFAKQFQRQQMSSVAYRDYSFGVD
jgi:hypothetical protein